MLELGTGEETQTLTKKHIFRARPKCSLQTGMLISKTIILTQRLHVRFLSGRSRFKFDFKQWELRLWYRQFLSSHNQNKKLNSTNVFFGVYPDTRMTTELQTIQVETQKVTMLADSVFINICLPTIITSVYHWPVVSKHEGDSQTKWNITPPCHCTITVSKASA